MSSRARGGRSDARQRSQRHWPLNFGASGGERGADRWGRPVQRTMQLSRGGDRGELAVRTGQVGSGSLLVCVFQFAGCLSAVVVAARVDKEYWVSRRSQQDVYHPVSATALSWHEVYRRIGIGRYRLSGIGSPTWGLENWRLDRKTTDPGEFAATSLRPTPHRRLSEIPFALTSS